MAKRKNFPKPLYLTPETLEYYHNRFFANLSMNFFANKNIFISKNCINNKSLPYDIGKLSGTYAHESWIEEKNNFSIFIISEEDYNNAMNCVFSPDVQFFIDNINRRQTIEGDSKKKITADVYIIKESEFYAYYKDRNAYIQEKLDYSCFSEQKLYLYASNLENNLF